MSELMRQTYYGNTVSQWLVAMLIVLAAFAIGKTLYWLLQRVGKRLAAKTSTQLDDIFIDLVEEPLVAVIVLIGIWLGLETLVLPEGLAAWIGRIFHVLVALTGGWLGARFVEAVFRHWLTPLAQASETDFDDQLLPVIRKGSLAIVWSIAIIVGLNNAGYDVAALLAGLGIGGLALAMAAKDTVANMFGGFTIFTDQPFKLKDRIKVSGFDGTVEEIGIRSTRIRTLDGRLVTVPNSKFADSPVENVSAEPGRKIVLELGLTYDTKAERIAHAIDLLKKIALENPAVRDDPVVGFTKYGDFSLGLSFVYWINKGEDVFGTQTAVNLAILSAFGEAGLDFAFPTQTLHVAKA